METDTLKKEIEELREELNDLRYVVTRKTGLSSSEIRGRIVAPSVVEGSVTVEDNSITNAKMANDAIKQAELDTELASVTVSAGNPTGTASVTAGSIIVGWRATGNQDQFIDSIAISSTTLTITLAANATADNTFQVTLLKA